MRCTTPALPTLALGLSLAFLVSCSSSSEPSSSSSGGPTSVTQKVGPDGATLVVDGATVTIPKGALDKEVEITIASNGAAPAGYDVLSKVYQCGPTGTDFKVPVTMNMPFTDDGKGPVTMFWTAGPDPAFKDIGGKPDGKMFSATVMHFSGGFAGRVKK